MIITTTPTIEGHTIKEYKGLVSGEVIFGMNFLKDFSASLRDFFGGRTNSCESAMLEVLEPAELRKELKKDAIETVGCMSDFAKNCTFFARLTSGVSLTW